MGAEQSRSSAARTDHSGKNASLVARLSSCHILILGWAPLGNRPPLLPPRPTPLHPTPQIVQACSCQHFHLWYCSRLVSGTNTHTRSPKPPPTTWPASCLSGAPVGVEMMKMMMTTMTMMMGWGVGEGFDSDVLSVCVP